MIAHSLSTRSVLGSRAFSLVEVVLALGIASFCLLLLTALIPTGLQSDKESVEESQGMNLLSGIITERMSLATTNACLSYPMPALAPDMKKVDALFYVKEGGQASVADLTGARYRVEYQIQPPATGSAAPYRGYFRVAWPAVGTNTQGSVETIALFPQP
jgi:uncharacterized protein (TIGR02598 family)